MKNDVVFNNLDEWLAYARGFLSVMKDGWRKKALARILPTVESYVHAVGGENHIDPSELIGVLRRVYPFGERKMHPYKAWLTEINILKTALRDKEKSWAEFDAWEVAIDLVEMDRKDEALTLLEREAPNRLGRKCPSCGRGRAKPCREVVIANDVAKPIDAQGVLFSRDDDDYRIRTNSFVHASDVGTATLFVDRVLPCRARVEPSTPRSAS